MERPAQQATRTTNEGTRQLLAHMHAIGVYIVYVCACSFFLPVDMCIRSYVVLIVLYSCVLCWDGSYFTEHFSSDTYIYICMIRALLCLFLPRIAYMYTTNTPRLLVRTPVTNKLRMIVYLALLCGIRTHHTIFTLCSYNTGARRILVEHSTDRGIITNIPRISVFSLLQSIPGIIRTRHICYPCTTKVLFY